MRKHVHYPNEKSSAKSEPLPIRCVKRLIHSFYLRYLTVEANARKKFTRVGQTLNKQLLFALFYR